MASAKAGVHVVQLRPIVVPDQLKEGYKFIKWDEDSTIGTPVTLRVDDLGFYLSWKDQHNETEFLEISSIRDARTGREAKLPKDPKVRDSVSMGPDIPLEDKTLSIAHGSEFVNVSIVNFCCNSKEVASMWADAILKMAYNLLAANASPYTLLRKSYTRLTLMADSKGKIPVKHIFKMFVQHKDDKKRVDKALESVGLPSGKNDKVTLSKFTMDSFFSFRNHLAPRPDVEAIFNQLIGETSGGPTTHPLMSSYSLPESNTITTSHHHHRGNSSSSKDHHHHHHHHHQSVSAVVSSIGSTILNKAAASVSRATGSSSHHHSSHHQKVMTVDQLVDFLNREQRDPRRNEILYPYADRSKGRDIIRTYEPYSENRTRDVMSYDGFLRYLMSDDCSIVDVEKIDLHQDMDQPLNHYFINSSHNTYLAGHQLTGKASVELYRQALLAGCRCVELDCWNGKTYEEEPIITHGYTVVTEIVLKDVLEAISDTAFKTSDFPVILSFENHCSPKQQAKIANYCRKIFGDRLVTEPLATNPLKAGVPLPSPNQLKRRFIIKNKKKDHIRRHRKKTTTDAVEVTAETATESPVTPSILSAQTSTSLTPQPSLEVGPDGTLMATTPPTITFNNGVSGAPTNMTGKSPERRLMMLTSLGQPTEATSSLEDSGDDVQSPEGAKVTSASPLTAQVPTAIVATSTSCDIEDTLESPESSGDEDEVVIGQVTSGDEVTAPMVSQEVVVTAEGVISPTAIDVTQVQATAHIKEAEAGAEMSALVVYIQPVRFHSFEYAERKNRSYEISSFVETEGSRLLKERPVDFVNFNKRQLTRIYPKGTRVDSSNYLPQLFWNAGCQMVALNYQTLDLGMQLNLGIFEYNGRSGYLLKPDFMRRPDRVNFDPSTESTVDGIIAGTVSVKIISGQFLSDKRMGTFVEVDMFGLPADMSRKKNRTKIVPNNGLNPVFGEETFIYRKVILPELACLRFAAYEESGRFIGHRIVPITGLKPGYRHIPLRNESGQPLLLASLFVHVQVKDYVPEEFSSMVDALSNPIAFQNMSATSTATSRSGTSELKRFETVKEE